MEEINKTQVTEIKETPVVEETVVESTEITPEKEPYLNNLNIWQTISQAFDNPLLSINTNKIFQDIQYYKEIADAMNNVFIENALPDKLSIRARQIMRDVIKGQQMVLKSIEESLQQQIDAELQPEVKEDVKDEETAV